MSHSSWPKMENPPSLGKDSNARALRGCRSQVSAEERGPTTLSLANRWVKWRNLPREGPRPVPHQPDLPNSTKYLSWGSDSFRPTGWRYHSLRHSLGSLTLFPRNVAMSHLPPYKMNRFWGCEITVVKIVKSPPRGARTCDRAHIIKILALILYKQMIL